MMTTDLDAAVTAILADDWGDRRAWFEFALASPACQAFVVDDGDRGVVGLSLIHI